MVNKPSHTLIRDPKIECMPVEDLKKLQLQRLKDLVERVYIQSPFYRRKFNEHGVKPEDIKTLDDLRRLPFTVKDDLRDNYPFGLFTVPMKDIIRIHCSSGTTGKPVTAGYTRNDMEMWVELMARSFVTAGVTSRDIVHNAFGYGLFTGGLGHDMGARKIGATVVPMSGGVNNRQIMLMKDFGATVLTATPSYAMVLAETAAQMGVNMKTDLKLRVGLFGAEPSTKEMHQHIEEEFNLEVYETYGIGEIIGPGIAINCAYHEGLHIQEDHFLAEIVDPDTGEPVQPGQRGDFVITTLTKEAMPLIRYRTRDLTRFFTEPCLCGRTTVRHDRLAGRTDDMLIIKGVNVFPSQVEGVLLRHSELAPQYLLIVERVNNRDKLEIQVEAATEEFYNQGQENLEQYIDKLHREMQQTLYISSKITIMPPRSIQRSEGKAKRYIDKRREANQI
ncbi:MAG: phenylacetate--CoA ligase [Firmicutes bacterium]|nr:phenylacetate--CoA ligase [Bacillota bacterium]